MASFAEAGGAINWKTTAYNNCGKETDISVFYGETGQFKKNQMIPKGGSHTFETGTQCPMALASTYTRDDSPVVTACLNGNNEQSLCAVVCANTTWQLNKSLSDGKCRFDRQ